MTLRYCNCGRTFETVQGISRHTRSGRGQDTAHSCREVPYPMLDGECARTGISESLVMARCGHGWLCADHEEANA